MSGKSTAQVKPGRDLHIKRNHPIGDDEEIYPTRVKQDISKESESAIEIMAIVNKIIYNGMNPEKLFLWYLNLYWLDFKKLMHQTVRTNYYNYVVAKMAEAISIYKSNHEKSIIPQIYVAGVSKPKGRL